MKIGLTFEVKSTRAILRYMNSTMLMNPVQNIYYLLYFQTSVKIR